MNGKKEGLGLYIHIPFCRSRCHYCSFYSIIANSHRVSLYLKALFRELEMSADVIRSRGIRSIYIGGGTPSILSSEQLISILDKLASIIAIPDDIEVTLEANPNDWRFEQASDLFQRGFNRLSFGVQTFDDDLLRQIGRRHNSADVYNSLEASQNAGFRNISIDLIYDLPRQTLRHWRDSLSRAVDLNIQHISFYNLTVEPGSSFYKDKEKIYSLMPDEDLSYNMLSEGRSLLSEAGFEQYEISAFCRDSKYAEHNIGYWKGLDYLGFGPAAHGFYEGSRYANIANLGRYMELLKADQRPLDFTEQLSEERSIVERLIINLRILKGVDLAAYTGLSEVVWDQINVLIVQGLLVHNGDNLRLSATGLDFYDYIAQELVLL